MQFGYMAKKSKKDEADGEDSSKDNIRWSQKIMDVVLIDELLEQQVNEYRVDRTFTNYNL